MTYYYKDGWKTYKACGKNCRPIEYAYDNPHNANIGWVPTSTETTGWCVFASLATLSGKTACQHAASYYANYKASLGIDGCDSQVGVSAGNLVNFIKGEMTVNYSAFTSFEECDLFKFFENKHTLLGLTGSDGVPEHAIAAFGIRRKANGEIDLHVYDSDVLTTVYKPANEILNFTFFAF